jgi:hypothetical protein
MAATVDRPQGSGRGEIVCAMCGRRFDPGEYAACGDCPLSSGCALACCPSCGFSNANPARSTLVRAYRRLTRS